MLLNPSVRIAYVQDIGELPYKINIVWRNYLQLYKSNRYEGPEMSDGRR